MQTDRVRLALGSPEEAAVIRWIFHQFVVERQSYVVIARKLNQAKVPNQHERPWTDGNDQQHSQERELHRTYCL